MPGRVGDPMFVLVPRLHRLSRSGAHGGRLAQGVHAYGSGNVAYGLSGRLAGPARGVSRREGWQRQSKGDLVVAAGGRGGGYQYNTDGAGNGRSSKNCPFDQYETYAFEGLKPRQTSYNIMESNHGTIQNPPREERPYET